MVIHRNHFLALTLLAVIAAISENVVGITANTLRQQINSVLASPRSVERVKTESMEFLLKKTIPNVSVEEFFNVCWMEMLRSHSQVTTKFEKTQASRGTIYRSFLERQGSKDIQIGNWIQQRRRRNDDVIAFCSNPSSSSRSSNTQTRVITYKYPLMNIPFIGGGHLANVKQTQCTHVESNFKEVDTVIRTEMDGVPMNLDAAVLEVRWVARPSKLSRNDLEVEARALVSFEKPIRFQNQIRSGMISKTKKVQSELFDLMTKALEKATEV